MVVERYDFVIIGAGGTGLAAAMYAARLGLKALVLGHSSGSEMPVGGVITTTNLVENYPGFPKISGTELAKKIEEHAREYKNVEIKNEEAKRICKTKEGFEVLTNKKKYFGKTILFATGTKWKKLVVDGAEKSENSGVSYCALCDGPLYRNKIVAVIGGSDSAAKEALVLAEHAKKVYIIYRGAEIKPEPINLKRVLSNKKIEIINNTNVIAVRGKSYVESVLLDRPFKREKELRLDALFVAIGHEALSGLASSLGVKLNQKKEIVINHINCKTSLAGVYAAGDVADKPFKQAITGVAEGCTAAYSAFEYIKKKS